MAGKRESEPPLPEPLAYFLTWSTFSPGATCPLTTTGHGCPAMSEDGSNTDADGSFRTQFESSRQPLE
jgi:hypothetical protein